MTLVRPQKLPRSVESDQEVNPSDMSNIAVVQAGNIRPEPGTATTRLEASNVPSMQYPIQGPNQVEETVLPERPSPRRLQHGWERWKPTLQRLYLDENRTLAEVMEIMKKQHKFISRYALSLIAGLSAAGGQTRH